MDNNKNAAFLTPSAVNFKTRSMSHVNTTGNHNERGGGKEDDHIIAGNSTDER